MQNERSFKVVDYVAIAVLFIPGAMDVWTRSWVSFTVRVLFGEDEVKAVQSSQRELAILCVKCTLCLILAFTSDFRNRKFLLYFGSLCLWLVTPIFGILTTVTRSSALARSLSWLAETLFVTSPLKYGLIFNQRLNPHRDQTRLVVALSEFMTSACSFLQFACYPNLETVRSTLITVWAAVITPLGAAVILLTLAIRGQITAENPRNPSIKELAKGICQVNVPETARRNKTAPLRFTIFTVLLCPAVAATIIFEAHEKITQTLTKDLKLNQNWYKFTGALINLLAIPVISLLVSMKRGTRGTLWEYLWLSFGHILNTVVMLLIHLNYPEDILNGLVLRSSQSGEPTWVSPITKDFPGKGVAVVRVFFHGPAKKFFFQSSLDENPKEVQYVSESVPAGSGPVAYEFSVWRKGRPRLNQSIVVSERKRYFFLATSKKVTYVQNVKDFLPENDIECVVVMSSIAEGHGDSLARNGQVFMSQRGKKIRSAQIPRENSSLQWCVPTRNTTFMTDIEPTKNTPLSLELKPYRESLLLISWESGREQGTVYLVTYLITWYEIRNLNSTKTLLVASHGLEGLVTAATTIGYVQFFWMEAPLYFRTTLFACTVVAKEVAARLVNLLVEGRTEKLSLALLSLSAGAGLVHIAMGAYYDFKLTRGE